MQDPDANLLDATLPVELSGQLDVGAASFHKFDAGDLEQLLRLERQCFSHPWSEKQFNLALEQELFNVFGFKHKSLLLAYLSLYHTGEELEIFNIGVLPQLRRRGFAKRLLGLVLQIGCKMGIKYAFLEVRESNTPARELYAGFGFEQVGRRKGYYPDNGEDALVMRLDLHNIPLLRGEPDREEIS